MSSNKHKGQTGGFAPILLVVGIIIIGYYVFKKEGSSKIVSGNESISEDYLRNSPQTQLAVINDKSNPPNKVTISLFSDFLSTLKGRFAQRSEQEIANALVSGYNIFITSEKSMSLVEFTTSFDAYSREIVVKKGFSIEEVLSLFIKSNLP